MFTGIVQVRGAVAALEPRPFGARLSIDAAGWRPAGRGFARGESICVSGVCLTLVEWDAAALRFDVVGETLSKTTLGGLGPGDAVNLEPSLTPATPMGGHFMQGHVDGVGRVLDVRRGGEDYRVAVEPPAELMDYVVPKGSVAIDGVSLTVAAVGERSFEVALIPTTLELTTMGALRPGCRVNLEADVIAKTVVAWLRRQRGVELRGQGR